MINIYEDIEHVFAELEEFSVFERIYNVWR